MSRLAVETLGNRVEVTDLESRLEQPNYTVNTLRHLTKVYPDDSLHLVIGSDIVEERHKWRGFDEIERLAPPIVVPRRGHGSGDEPNYLLPEICSGGIRRLIAEGKPIDDFVSVSVLDYIRCHHLYGL